MYAAGDVMHKQNDQTIVSVYKEIDLSTGNKKMNTNRLSTVHTLLHPISEASDLSITDIENQYN